LLFCLLAAALLRKKFIEKRLVKVLRASSSEVTPCRARQMRTVGRLHAQDLHTHEPTCKEMSVGSGNVGGCWEETLYRLGACVAL